MKLFLFYQKYYCVITYFLNIVNIYHLINRYIFFRSRVIFANIKIVNNENKYYVLLKPPYCSCLYFLEFGICKHFIYLCKLLNYYSDDNVREFVYVKKKVDQNTFTLISNK
ncbi:hypothetical protein BpHYR1_015250 [Brachionus plicatilis]|uniref:SWIM-type domain-containing protein n=1 Tax=Brachionus plicatilis TaxID=10195 RepID=A0A3M7Q525_BRAPC|nr:hypothetical protein BpHYR1_015250 [Brachionus plicatilis]